MRNSPKNMRNSPKNMRNSPKKMRKSPIFQTLYLSIGTNFYLSIGTSLYLSIGTRPKKNLKNLFCETKNDSRLNTEEKKNCHFAKKLWKKFLKSKYFFVENSWLFHKKMKTMKKNSKTIYDFCQKKKEKIRFFWEKIFKIYQKKCEVMKIQNKILDFFSKKKTEKTWKYHFAPTEPTWTYWIRVPTY